MSEKKLKTGADKQPEALASSGQKSWSAGDTEILSIKLDEIEPFERLRVAYRCEIEGKVNYVALGFRYPSGFHHLKQKHIVTDRVMNFDIGPQDLVLLMESEWTVPEGDPSVLELWVKFASDAQGRVDLLEVESRQDQPLTLDGETISEKISIVLADALTNSGLKHYSTALALAEKMLAEPVLAVSSEDIVEVEPTGEFANGYEALGNSARYLYHSLGHVRIFLIAFEQTGRKEFLTLARLWTERWWRENYHAKPEDLKYAYYDHGVAERSMVMSRLVALMVQYNSSHVETALLVSILHAHLRLLASWGFVSRHQPFYVHNHAIFQAIALLLGALLFAHDEDSEIWTDYAAQLLHDQVDGLLTHEGVSIENSSGYHIGLERILENVFQLLRPYMTDLPSILTQARELSLTMSAFTERLAYSPNRQSAFGDTKYTLNRSLKKLPSPRVERLQRSEDLWVLETAGYASLIARIGGDREMTLTAIASALEVTHKHDDDLSFSIGTSDGVEWIADPGFHAYDDSEPSRYAKSADAHDVVILEGREYSRSLNQASLKALDAPQGFSAFMGEHHHYAGFVVSRIWVWSEKDKALLVEDRVVSNDGAKVGTFSLAWPLGDAVTARRMKDGSFKLYFSDTVVE